VSAPKISALLEKLKTPIAPPAAEEEIDLTTVEDIPSGSTPPPLPHEAMAPFAVTSLRDDARFWSELGTRLWRAERQLRRMNEGEKTDGLDRLTRRFEEVFETLHQNNIEIHDHTGEKYDSGLTLKVLQYEPQEGITSEVILETVKPSVRLHGVLVPGEVIVATPIVKPVQEPQEQAPTEPEQEILNEVEAKEEDSHES
jgi:hypothetical protein